jgi:hypothetical protein
MRGQAARRKPASPEALPLLRPDPGRSATIQLNTDATRINQAFSGSGYVQMIVNGEVQTFVQRYRAGTPPPVDLETYPRAHMIVNSASRKKHAIRPASEPVQEARRVIIASPQEEANGSRESHVRGIESPMPVVILEQKAVAEHAAVDEMP